MNYRLLSHLKQSWPGKRANLEGCSCHDSNQVLSPKQDEWVSITLEDFTCSVATQTSEVSITAVTVVLDFF